MAIHYNGPKSTTPGRVACGAIAPQAVTQEWESADCSGCRLECLMELPAEYAVPQHVQETDRALTLADAQRRADVPAAPEAEVTEVVDMWTTPRYDEDMTNLSKDARDALTNAGTNRQGAVVQANGEVLRELTFKGIIGPGGGLTRRGTIAREKAMRAALDGAFSL